MSSSGTPCAKYLWGMGLLPLAALAAGSGCSSVGAGPRSADAGENKPGNGETFPVTIDEEEEPDAGFPEGDFLASATAVELAGNFARITGAVSAVDDVDVYAIGRMEAGDELAVDVRGTAPLDAVAAVFDDHGDLLYANDDRAYYAGLVDPRIHMRFRHGCEGCYVAISSSVGTDTVGDYVLDITRTSAGVSSAAETQYVYFNFDGADAVAIGTRAPVDIPAFDASLIAPQYAGRTEELVDLIMTLVREDYDGLNVEFISSRRAAPPAPPYTTIHFGAYDANLLGIADNVDEYNEQASQQAIIFVDTFQAFTILDPTLEEMAQALANVASHETGHLLGLQHTHDPRSIMDVTASLRQMMGPQAFRRSPLDPRVFPDGHQNAPQLLVDAVGGDLARLKAASAKQLGARALWYDEGDGEPARAHYTFSSCLCESCRKHPAGQ